jgi:hypothetical protein
MTSSSSKSKRSIVLTGRTLCAAVSILTSSLIFHAYASSGDLSGMELKSSNFFTVYYHPAADLSRIRRDLSSIRLPHERAADYGEVSEAEKICYRLDELFTNVKELLGSYPKMPKIKLVICRDRAELAAEYHRLIGAGECPLAFHAPGLDAILDHYFGSQPPEASSEILASYVDAYFQSL